jgi:hypothetical protein
VTDARMQHHDTWWIEDDMFASLRRWKPGPFSEAAPPLETTVEAMDEADEATDEAGGQPGLPCARHDPASR